jgi:trehalose utilization protein
MVVKSTLRKSASPKQALSKSLGAVVSNKWMKNADVKWTVKLAEKTLSTAKQKLRTHDASMWWTKQQHDALKKQVKTAEKNLKSLNKTASKRK